MYCKIDRVVIGEGIVAVSVSGRIAGEHVEMLRQVLEQEPGGVVLDLRNLSLVDREAVKLFASSEAKGYELRNCPRYVREWVTKEIGATRGIHNLQADNQPHGKVR